MTWKLFASVIPKWEFTPWHENKTRWGFFWPFVHSFSRYFLSPAVCQAQCWAQRIQNGKDMTPTFGDLRVCGGRGKRGNQIITVYFIRLLIGARAAAAGKGFPLCTCWENKQHQEKCLQTQPARGSDVWIRSQRGVVKVTWESWIFAIGMLKMGTNVKCIWLLKFH